MVGLKVANCININIENKSMNMSKRNLLMVILFSFLFWGCNNEDLECLNENEPKTTINLIAPNGQRIANDIESLTELLDEIAEESFGGNKDIEIDKIIYHDTDMGFLAEVVYKTYDGYLKNVIITNTLLKSNLNLSLIKTRREDGMDGETNVYSCKNNDTKKCSECEVGVMDDIPSCSCQNGDKKYCELKVRKE